MPRRPISALVAVGALLVLLGCTAPTPPPSTPEPSTSAPAAEVLPDAPPAFDGSWTLTRTVVESDDPTQPVGSVETRTLIIGPGTCIGDRCEGTLKVGTSASDLIELPWVQLGTELSYDLTGANDCVFESGEVVLADAYAYAQHVELTAAESEGDRVTSLTGVAQYDYASKPRIWEYDCEETAGTIMYSYVGTPA